MGVSLSIFVALVLRLFLRGLSVRVGESPCTFLKTVLRTSSPTTSPLLTAPNALKQRVVVGADPVKLNLLFAKFQALGEYLWTVETWLLGNGPELEVLLTRTVLKKQKLKKSNILLGLVMFTNLVIAKFLSQDLQIQICQLTKVITTNFTKTSMNPVVGSFLPKAATCSVVSGMDTATLNITLVLQKQTLKVLSFLLGRLVCTVDSAKCSNGKYATRTRIPTKDTTTNCMNESAPLADCKLKVV